MFYANPQCHSRCSKKCPPQPSQISHLMVNGENDFLITSRPPLEINKKTLMNCQFTFSKKHMALFRTQKMETRLFKSWKNKTKKSCWVQEAQKLHDACMLLFPLQLSGFGALLDRAPFMVVNWNLLLSQCECSAGRRMIIPDNWWRKTGLTIAMSFVSKIIQMCQRGSPTLHSSLFFCMDSITA